MAEANLLLEDLLTRAGVSNSRLAREIVSAAPHLSYDHASVIRWIRDHQVPRDPVPQIICNLLSDQLGIPVTLADIGMDKPRGPHQQTAARLIADATALWTGETRGRLPQTLLTGAHACAPVWDWASPPHSMALMRDGRRRVDVTDIADLRQLRTHYQQMYRRVGGEPVRPLLARALTTTVAPLLRAAYDNDIGRQLFRAAGGLAALAGIFAYDTDLQPLGQRHLVTALRLAKAAGDRSFGAYVVALLANLALFLDERLLVIQYAEAALRNGGSALDPALVIDLHALAGKAYARMGEHADCRTHLRLSTATAGRLSAMPADAEASYVQPGLVETQAAEAFRRLHDLTAAEEHARESVLTAPATHPRGQVHRYAGLALILAEKKTPGEAAEMGTDAGHGGRHGVRPHPRPDQPGGHRAPAVRHRTRCRGLPRPRGAAPTPEGTMMRWKVHSERTIHQDQWVHLVAADVELPNGRHLDHRLIRTATAGAGLVIVIDGSVLLMWRHRFITDTYGWEIPIGSIEPGEDPATAAAREAEEETGWRPTGPIEPLLYAQPSPGLMASEHFIFQAHAATYVGPPVDDFESDKIDWVPLSDVPSLIRDRHISSGTTMNALLFALASKG